MSDFAFSLSQFPHPFDTCVTLGLCDWAVGKYTSNPYRVLMFPISTFWANNSSQKTSVSSINIEIVALFFPSKTRFLPLEPSIQSWVLLSLIVVQTNFLTIHTQF